MRRWRMRRIAGVVAAIAVTTGLMTGAPAMASVAAANDPIQNAEWMNLNESFVERDGARLTLDGQTFRFNGANAYWLGLDENVGGVDFPTYFRIKDALDTAKELGLSVIRSHMMTSTGQDNANPLAIMPRLGEYNEDAFATIDFAIAYAGSLGIRLLLPLTDEWAYYHGGHRDFTTPLGLESSDFYTDREAIAAYQDYVAHILGRTNALTGVRYVDDPTILAWELGNELEGMTTAWITEQVDFIKSQAPDQLVAAGRRFDIDPDTLQAVNLDIVDVHYYPPTADRVAADAATVVGADKVYIAGEYGSPAASTDLFGPLVENSDVTGIMFWSLFPHNDRGGFVPHDDGFTLHYPGTTDKARSQNEAIKAYSRALGFATDTVALEEPLITEVTTNNGINSVAWRGTAGAATYLIERSDNGKSWSEVAEVPAEASPVLDEDGAGDVRYRVTARKADGTTSVSDEVAVPRGAGVLVDPLESLLLTSASEDVAIIPGPDGSKAVATAESGSLTWRFAGATTASFLLAGADSGALRIASSANGIDWAEAVLVEDEEDGLLRVTASELAGDNVRITLAGELELMRATITGIADPAALIDPLNDFSLVASREGALSIDGGNPAQFGGDSGRVKRDSADPASLTWHYDDISSANFTTWYWPDQPVIPLVVSGSEDGETFTTLTPQVTGGTGNWKQYNYSVSSLTNVNYLKVSWEGAQGEPWTPQIGQLTLFSPNVSAPTAPGSFSGIRPADGAENITGTPTLTWETAPGAAFYRVLLAQDPALTDIVEQSPAVSTPSYTPATPLKPGTAYFWQVTAVNGYGETSTSVLSFSTAALPSETLTVDDFESYADDAAVSAAYQPNSGGGPVAVTLDANPVTGTRAGEFTYDLTGPGYAGAVRTLATSQSWWGYQGVEFEASANPGQTLSVQFVAAGSYWEADVPVADDGWQTYSVEFASFANPPWAGESKLDLADVTQYAFYLGGTGAGSLLIDDVRVVPNESESAEPSNTVAPSIEGSPSVGTKLVATEGEWIGPDLVFSYQWTRDGEDIAGARSAHYTVKRSDQGKEIEVVVTATNDHGSASIASAPIAVLYDVKLSLSLSSEPASATVQLKSAVEGTSERKVQVHVGATTLEVGLNSAGEGTVSLPPLDAGKYRIVAEFAGDEALNSARSNERTLVVRD